ncbi:3-oxoacyl-[acyl-carrier-protein] synthase III C-terminal domain-containing protein [Longirhabdus pacifica]|uniref:3-oxoacyl-[acyl-carrier-protein] synthase III C-terminal domain-containing protein n=1 Tax=Longirhabdus pacifica TaxID=2305227 RepID=UPI001008FC56|nr:3-oxoacyl-[acyl-carrier-protein] synthase III C-terminal domain-containing protein [Longirhabdus pacifica]
MQIGKLAIYEPQQRLTVEQYYKQQHITLAEKQSLIEAGIHSIPMASDVTAYDMLEQTVENMLQHEDIAVENVQYVMVPYLYFSFPHSFNLFSKLREKFQLHHAMFFSLRDLLCANVLMSLHVAAEMLSSPTSSDEDIGLMVTVEKTMLADQRYGGGYFMTADGAAGISMGKALAGDTFIAFHAVSDTRTIQQGKMKNGRDDVPDYFYYVNLTKNMKYALRKASLTMDDIALIIPNNITKSTWPLLSRMMKISTERFYTDGLQERGHMNNADLLYNLHDVRSKKLLKEHDYYMLLTLGNGGVICCAICQRGDTVYE